MYADAELLVRRAVWVGQHALPLYLAMLALLLAASSIGWWALHRGRPPGAQRLRFSLRWRMTTGGVVILTGVAVFAALAASLGAQGALSRVDQALTTSLLLSVPPRMLQVFAALTHLGDPATLTGLCIAVALVLMVRGRHGLALAWVIAVAGNGLLNQTLKQFFGRVRPLDPDGVVLAHGFSFPSGHSSGAVVAYGMLAYLVLRLLPARWHLPALLAALAIAYTVGASRLILRVHFASDVMAGFASGAAWLALCVTSIELIRCLRQPPA